MKCEKINNYTSLLVTIIGIILLSGCTWDNNQITIVNNTDSIVSNIRITAGGYSYLKDKLNGGEKISYSFNPKKEGGGLITAELNNKKIRREFGYFTPNLKNKISIILNSKDEIKIVDLDSTTQSVDEIITNNYAAKQNLHILGNTLETDKHLFILSGQSNMQGHRPNEAFTPTVKAALGAEKIIVVQDAMGGQPIKRWWKKWKSPDDNKLEPIGDLYDRLMLKVQQEIKEQKLATITFIWMQGERDANKGWGKLYEASLIGLYQQLSEDIGRKDINFVIGRLSDFDLKNTRYPHWTMIREAQVKVGESNPRFSWVNTDDLNDGISRKGKKIENDLHYSAEGYKMLGKRFAENALKLIRNNTDKENTK